MLTPSTAASHHLRWCGQACVFSPARHEDTQRLELKHWIRCAAAQHAPATRPNRFDASSRVARSTVAARQIVSHVSESPGRLEGCGSLACCSSFA
jgi:hypothetical protein